METESTEVDPMICYHAVCFFSALVRKDIWLLLHLNAGRMSGEQ